MTVRLTPRPPASFTWDGQVFDLTHPWVDVIGVEWNWTGAYSSTGEPLMGSEQGGTLRTLPDLYRGLGPLLPILPRLPLSFGGAA